MAAPHRRAFLLLAALALLAVLAYLPTLHQPLLEDDYPNLAIALKLGAPAAWQELADTVFRLRATSLWTMGAMWHTFGMNPLPYYCLGILLHILNTWLVYALGFWRPLGYRLTAWAAVFFAVSEGHQEAVMWFSACNELLQFLFGTAAFLCWLHFLAGGRRRGWWYGAALLGFSLALISKESAVVFAALFLLPLVDAEARRSARWVLPFMLLAGASALSIYDSRDASFRFQDASFRLSAPFWRTWLENMARLFWFWGLLGLAFSWRSGRRAAMLALAWAGLGLLPYSFLLYSTRIPSRQLYLASAGTAWIVGAGLVALEDRFTRSRRAVTAVVCTILLLHNIGYLWTKKRRQFLERAEPTEELIALARRTKGPIYVRCFPRNHYIAEEAVHMGAGKPPGDIIWDAAEARVRGAAAEFCYEPK